MWYIHKIFMFLLHLFLYFYAIIRIFRTSLTGYAGSVARPSVTLPAAIVSETGTDATFIARLVRLGIRLS